MLNVTRIIPNKLMAKVAGKTQVKPNASYPQVLDIMRLEEKTIFMYYNPGFTPSVFAQGNNPMRIITVEPCSLFKGYKVTAVEERWQSGAGGFKQSTKVKPPSKWASAKWLRDLLKSQNLIDLS